MFYSRRPIAIVSMLMTMGLCTASAHAADLVSQLSDATVFIQVAGTKPDGKTRNWSGTGFAVSPDGYVITNRHVVPGDKADFTSARVFFNPGTKNEFDCSCQLIAKHPCRDVALVKCNLGDRRVPFLAVAPFDDVSLGQDIRYAGFPAGRVMSTDLRSTPSVSVSTTTVSSLRNDVDDYLHWIDVNQGTVGGSSGSPIVNENNEAIAILSRGNGVMVRGVPASAIQETLGIGFLKVAVEREGSTSEPQLRIRVTPTSQDFTLKRGEITLAATQKAVTCKRVDDGLTTSIILPDDFRDREVNLAAIDVELSNEISVRTIVRIDEDTSYKGRVYVMIDRAHVSGTKTFGVPYDNPLDSPDPFATIYVNGQGELKSETCDDTVHFADHVGVFCKTGDQVKITFYDEDVANHDLIGSIELTAQDGLQMRQCSDPQIKSCRLSVVAVPYRLPPDTRMTSNLFGK